MRTLIPFALALAGIGAFSTDASAFGRRRAAAASTSDGGCYGGGHVSSGYGGCYGSGHASSGCYGSGYASSYGGGCHGSGYSSHNYGSCYGSGYASSGYGGCYGSRYASSYGGGYGSGYAHSGYGQGSAAYSSPVAYSGPASYSVNYSGATYGASYWVPATMNGGRAAVIQATDGTYYTLGANGTYYATTQAHSGATTVTSGSSYTPAGSSGTNLGPNVIPAGGTAPLTESSTTTTSSFRAKQVLGTRILIQNDTQVGTVEDMVSDKAGNLDYLVVSTADGKLVTVPWDAAKFDAEKKTATVNVTQEVWRTVPTYTATTYPQFYTPTYRTDIYKAYGLTPRDLRRIP